MKEVRPFERFADIGGLKENRQCAMLIHKVKKGLLNETVLSGWLEFASTEVVTNMREGDTDDTEIICIVIICNVYKGMLANELNRIDKMGKCQFVDYIFLDKDANTIYTSNAKSMNVSDIIDVVDMSPDEFIKTFDDGEGFNGIISNGGKRSFILILDFEDKDWMDAFIKFQTDKVSICGNTVAVEYEDVNRRKFIEFVNIAIKMDGVKSLSIIEKRPGNIVYKSSNANVIVKGSNGINVPVMEFDLEKYIKHYNKKYGIEENDN